MLDEEPLFARLYLDEDVHKRVAVALRLRLFDVISAHEIGAWGLSDEEQLALASRMDRVLFTFNAAHFIRLHEDRISQGAEYPGILVSEQLEIGETVRRLISFLNRVTRDEMRNQINWLPAVQQTRGL
jgi:hypothetical protein